MAIVHRHPNGPEHVLALYGEDGLWFHCLTGHDAPHEVTGEMDPHELTQWHTNQHAPEAATVADPDHFVDPELLADAIGPVPVEEFYLRPSCDDCNRLAAEPVGAESARRIRDHVLNHHAHQVTT
jgi:hypothetical protein